MIPLEITEIKNMKNKFIRLNNIGDCILECVISYL